MSDPLGRSTPPIDRLVFRCVETEHGCWEFTGPKDHKGYARFRVQGRKVFAHRFMWEFFRGPWPEGLTYDHLCQNKACVNPWHGEPVPSGVNSKRAQGNRAAINAAKTHCPQGHPLSGANLRYAPRGTGRVCRICRAESGRAYRARLKDRI